MVVPQGMAPLHFAAAAGYRGVLEILLKPRRRSCFGISGTSIADIKMETNASLRFSQIHTHICMIAMIDAVDAKSMYRIRIHTQD